MLLRVTITLVLTICLLLPSAVAQNTVCITATRDTIKVPAPRASVERDGTIGLMTCLPGTFRVTNVRLQNNSPALTLEHPQTPFLIHNGETIPIRVHYSPNGNADTISDKLIVSAEDSSGTGSYGEASSVIKAFIGDPLPIDTIHLTSIRSAGLLPNSIRFRLVLDSALSEDVGFGIATFKYKQTELNPGDYRITADSTNGEFRYSSIRIVPDNLRHVGDTVADLHFYILSSDTNNVLELIRLEWFAKFTGEAIYTHTVVDEAIVSDVHNDYKLAANGLTLSVFPNPAEAFATVSYTCSIGTTQLALYSSMGVELIHLSAFVTSESQMLSVPLDLSSVPPGVYYVRLSANALR